MSGLPDLLVLLLALPLALLAFAAFGAQEILIFHARDKAFEAERRAAQQAELHRKIAIAEAAAAARARGEAFVPPPDYDR